MVLELGGNAACIVEDLVPDLDGVVARLWYAGFYQSGQSCISMQRLYVNEKIYEDVKAKLVEETRKLKKGDPLDEDTKIGPIISEKEAMVSTTSVPLSLFGMGGNVGKAVFSFCSKEFPESEGERRLSGW